LSSIDTDQAFSWPRSATLTFDRSPFSQRGVSRLRATRAVRSGWVIRDRVEPTADQAMCAVLWKRKFPEHQRLRQPRHPTGFRTLQM